MAGSKRSKAKGSSPAVVAVAQASRIERLHKELEREFSVYTSTPVEIRPEPEFEANWQRRFGGDVEFLLWMQPNVPQFAALRQGGRSRCPVAPLKTKRNVDTSEIPWVSWREVWVKHPGDAFALKSASFAFYWGRSTSLEGENQLFRAEWDQLHDVDVHSYGSPKSAHPHWHIDWPLTNVQWSISHIHLGMAGWNLDNEFPKCWQQRVDGDWTALQVWAKRTLQYALDQFLNFAPESDPSSTIFFEGDLSDLSIYAYNDSSETS